MFCAWVDGKTTEKKKEILKLVRKFRVKKAKMMNGSVSGQIFQPVENSSGAFLTYLTSHPTRSRLIAVKKKTYTPNANMADLSVGPGLVARKRG